jgi:hypothetical protein
MDNLVVNVEAVIARGYYDEADASAARAAELLLEAQTLLAAARKLADPFARADGERAAQAVYRQSQQFRDAAEAARRAGRDAVLRSESLDPNTPPELLEPTKLVALTAEEITARAASALTAAWANLRADRDTKLDACDWTQLPDSPADATTWAAYRQKLRDLPATTTDPTKPAWPTPPA